MAKITLNNVTVSDAYMALLADRGIDYWFANAGTDFAPVVETLAKAQVLETGGDQRYLFGVSTFCPTITHAKTQRTLRRCKNSRHKILSSKQIPMTKKYKVQNGSFRISICGFRFPVFGFVSGFELGISDCDLGRLGARKQSSIQK